MRKLKKLAPRFDVTVLDGLIEDDTSCIEKLRTQHHLALHPFHLNSLRDSIKDILDKGLSKYNKELEGILCGYNNINILNYLAKIFDDSCFIHLDIEADFYIFKPTVGRVLNGVVNKISKDHVGCLIHKTFNVSIPRPAKDKHWLGDKVMIGSEIILEVEHTDFDGLLPYIRGKLTSVLTQPEDGEDLEQLLKKRAKKKKLRVSFDDNDNSSYQEESPKKKRKKKEKNQESFEENSEIVDETEIPKRRKKSKSFSETEIENDFKQKDQDNTEIVEETETPKKRKKSKSFSETTNTEIEVEESPKKQRHRSLSECDIEIPEKKTKKIKPEQNETINDSIHFEDNSEIVPKKKHKKIKSEMGHLENYTTDLENETSEIVSKKKKKFKTEMDNSENNSTYFEDTVEIAPKKKYKIKSEITFEDHPLEEIDGFNEQESPSKKKKIKRDLPVDEEEVPKKKKIKRELDSF